MLILGGPGTGKSSIIAKAADETSTLALNNKIPGYLPIATTFIEIFLSVFQIDRVE